MLIGLHGKKQAGKDTTFERIDALLGAESPAGRTVVRVSFADKLYESAAASLNVDPELLRTLKSVPSAVVTLMDDRGTYPASGVYSSQSVREYLQHYGTEAHRDTFGDSFWVDNVDLEHEGRIVVVTDVRFANEAQAVIDAGGAVVHVVGPEDVETAGDGHASEETLGERYIDARLYNVHRSDGFHSLDREVHGLFLTLRRQGY